MFTLIAIIVAPVVEEIQRKGNVHNVNDLISRSAQMNQNDGAVIIEDSIGH